MAEYTPMMRQYFSVKNQYEDAILFYRLGDFYEMFFQDAIIASRELDLTLTGRDCGQAERAPMCGVPFHSADQYIARLVSRGYKVAICEQLENPAEAKDIVRRDVIRIVTPGTVCDSDVLDEGRNNYLACVYSLEDTAGICFSDLSTGKVLLTEVAGSDVLGLILNEFGKYPPSELLINSGCAVLNDVVKFAKNRLSCCVNIIQDEEFDFSWFEKKILSTFKVGAISELYDERYKYATGALGETIGYLCDTQKRLSVDNITNVEFYLNTSYMSLNLSTRRNLELMQTMRSQSQKGTLIDVIDKTKTAMGKRALRAWISRPLLSLSKITARHAAVEELVSDSVLLDDITEILKNVRDVERIMTKVVYSTANARDLKTICDTVTLFPSLKASLKNCKSPLLRKIFDNIDELEDIEKLLSGAIVDEPPFSVREGGMIRRGYNSEVDELRSIMGSGKDVLSSIEAQEQEKTGIKKLRIGYNRVFGYYIEVLNTQKDLVPDNYIRKQTLSNCERYITEELKNLESKILGAKDRLVTLEYELLDELRKKVADEYPRFQMTSSAVAGLDALCSFARAAIINNYVRPDMVDGDVIEIKNGRHPVVENMLEGNIFVPNNTLLDCSQNRLAIITGPNMAGKSTYMRQVALISLMAQAGSFVPATSARLCIVDNIFTRIGASDDLASGKSTFMVEMSEVAEILKNATNRSLIIFDEIGRGTSTYDGMSIARAVLEYASDRKKLGAKTLFATHYHELTELEETLEGVKNYSIAAKKRGDDVIFLRRIVRGGADESYGIEVAKLSGVPDVVVKRAKEILKSLSENGPLPVKTSAKRDISDDDGQISLLSMADSEIAEELRNIDINTLTPIEALSVLNELINKAKQL